MFVRTDQDRIGVKSDINEREVIVLIRRLEEVNAARFWRQGNIRLRVEVAGIEGKGDYQRSRFEGRADLTPPA